MFVLELLILEPELSFAGIPYGASSAVAGFTASS
jgi:hypothetical protein